MVRPFNAVSVPRGPKARAGGEHERGIIYLLVRGFGGPPPRIFFRLKMSVEAILIHFETMFACEIWLIVQAFHVAVFKCVSPDGTTKELITISTPQ